MANPLRSEAAAFRFLLLTIGYFALIAIAAWIETWLGVAVFVVLTFGIAARVARNRTSRSRELGPP